MENCGYWLYSGRSDVPKIEISGSIKKIATDLSDPDSWDLAGRPVLDWDAEPLPDSAYDSQSCSVARIFTRAEKGQALTHLEMDFNLASLFHKANTSSISSSFDSSELSTRKEIPENRPWYRRVVVGTFHHNDLSGVEMQASVEDDSEYQQQLANWDNTGSIKRFGPYKFPVGLSGSNSATANFYRETPTIDASGRKVYTYEKTIPTGSDLDWNETDSYYYVYYKELVFDKTTGTYPDLQADCYVRNGNSFVEIEETDPEVYKNGAEEEEENPDKDAYYNLRKPTRAQEKAGLFATFSYAPIKVGNQTIIQNPFQTIKVQHTTDEIRYKLANEQIPGTLHIRQNFYVTGSSYMREDLTVLGSTHVSESVDIRNSLYVGEDTSISGSTVIGKNLEVVGKGTIKEDLEVEKNAIIHQTISGGKDLYIAGDFDIGKNGVLIQGRQNPTNSSDYYYGTRPDDITINGNVRINGCLYVDGWLGGNLSNRAYNTVNSTPNYALAYQRFGTQDTASYDTGSQSDARLKKNPLPIFDPLYKLDQVRGYEFDWAEEAEKSGHDVGLIAQELQTVYPEAVAEGQDGYLRIDYTKLVPLLVEAIRELRCQVKELQRRK